MTVGGTSCGCCAPSVQQQYQQPVVAAQPTAVAGVSGGGPTNGGVATQPTTWDPMTSQSAYMPTDMLFGPSNQPYAPFAPAQPTQPAQPQQPVAPTGTTAPMPTSQPAPTVPGSMPQPGTSAGSVDPAGGPATGSAQNPSAVMPPAPSAQNPYPAAPGKRKRRPAGGVDGAASGAAPLPGTAAALATWPQWQAALKELGVAQRDIRLLGREQLTEQQLSEVYLTLANEVGQSQTPSGSKGEPGVPGQTPGAPGVPGQAPGKPGVPGAPGQTVPGTPAWDAAWEKKFTALGVPAAEVAQLKQLAITQGLGDEQLQQIYDEAKATMPGWNAEWEKKFTDLGLPADAVQAFKDSQAPVSGLEAAYNNFVERRDAFKASGDWEKFEDAGATDEEIWSVVISDVEGEEREKALEQIRAAHMPSWKRWLHVGLSFVPGFNLVEYIRGREFLTETKVDRGNIMNIATAALSGFSAFTAVRGALSVAKGLQAVNAVRAGGVVGLEGAKLGALETMSLGKKISAFIPFTSTHKAVVGWGNMVDATRAFTGGGEAMLKAAGAVDEASAIRNVIDSVKTGTTSVIGAKNQYLPILKRLPFRMGAEPASVVAGQAGNVLTWGKNMSVGRDGLAKMAELAKVAGANPGTYMQGLSLADEAAALGAAGQAALGTQMLGTTAGIIKDAGMLARGGGVAGSVLGRLFPGVAEHASKAINFAPSRFGGATSWALDRAAGMTGMVAGSALVGDATEAGITEMMLRNAKRAASGATG